MTSSTSYRTSTYKTMLITLALVINLFANPILAHDHEEVARICSRTLEPDVCKDCVFSDPSRGSVDIPELIHTVAYCMYSHAVNAHNHAAGMAQNASSGDKRAFQVCSNVLLGASNTLWDAINLVEVANYYGAYDKVRKSHWSLLSCDNAFRKYAPYMEIPEPLSQEMMLTKRLFDVVHYFFSLIIKINPN